MQLIFLQDTSSSDGDGLTGVAFGDVTWYFIREDGTTPTEVTAVDMTLPTWVSGGFTEIHSTNMPGFYMLGLTDASLASGADFVGQQLKGATNMAQLNLEIQLTELGLSEDVPLTAQDIEDQVNDAINTAIAELGVGVPTATPNLRSLGMLMYMALRNKLDVPTSGTDALEIHNDAGTIIAKKLLTDAGGDYSEAKAISG